MSPGGPNPQATAGPLRNVGVAFIDVNFPREELLELRKKLKPAGEADVLVTALKSPSRIGRHIPAEAPSVPVVQPKWISETIDAGFTLPFGEYSIEIPDDLRPRKRPRIAPPPHPAPAIASPPARSDDESERNTTDDERRLPPGAGNLDPRFRNTKYACQRHTPLEHRNRALIAELEVVARQRELASEDERALAYRKAAAALRAYPRDILTAIEAGKIRCIGPKIGAAIREFLRRGHVPEAKELRADPEFRAAELFLGVYGAGPAAVRAWIAKGYRSLDELKEGEGYDSEEEEAGQSKRKKGHDGHDRHYRGLTEKQKKGLKWYDALRETMSGADAEEIHDLVAAEVERIVPGSIVEHLDKYRRGKREGIKNVDLLVTPPSIERFDRLLSKLLSVLDKKGLILDVFMLKDDDEDDAPRTLPGSAILARLKTLPPEADPTRRASLILRQPSSGRPRAVHIVVCPTPCRPYALACLTGSTIFVRSMREYLDKEKGYKISNHGLFDLVTGARVAECETERDVFDKMGLPWIEPEGRNC
ncbi:hypothetical protein DFJ74DRAFT_736332 [Hyaloraphidium curvatum]|nr:hypothetical protein DFJ74DRAFT_736332 [Hyaloraphidium curvatum]